VYGSQPNANVERATIIHELKALIKNNNDNLEEQIPWYGTPLHIAISNNHVEAVKILLSAGANMESLAPDESGAPLDTALTLAARQGRREIVKLLWDQGASRKGKKPSLREYIVVHRCIAQC
jgi:ankyrin repeat protein